MKIGTPKMTINTRIVKMLLNDEEPVSKSMSDKFTKTLRASSTYASKINLMNTLQYNRDPNFS